MNTASFSPWHSILSLLFVLGVILAIGWVIKRSRIQLTQSPIPMKIVAALALGPREKLLVVEISDQWHVIGVTPHSINLIAQLPRQNLAASESSMTGQNFLASLQARLKK
jgi:flagellar protein FliO/FliZ